MDSKQRLEEYLHRQIPLSAAMGVSVSFVSDQSVVLSAPLGPNINHKQTVFGGSASAVAILAAWSLVHLRLEQAGRPSEIVIQANHMAYDKPMVEVFTATSRLVDETVWPAFVKTLARKKRARLDVQSVLASEGLICGRMTGSFVAFLRDRTQEPS
ncbi:thioesterase [Xaviernesmea oryzae]|uniref:Thioesterase n=1 Tax=Xaviernesmea oryzae TaxID=464029 RepID=A0A1Q9AZF3_9HYPH|nr:YiiD C-terminal domain-containing protein [Xaviernesmea oryzae]OLP61088.1 thioesterase [Xaviernesmea oryzae]SEL13856.1 thioesterase domain-containing protein, putative [Xaviernesmea oryzae]